MGRPPEERHLAAPDPTGHVQGPSPGRAGGRGRVGPSSALQGRGPRACAPRPALRGPHLREGVPRACALPLHCGPACGEGAPRACALCLQHCGPCSEAARVWHLPETRGPGGRGCSEGARGRHCPLQLRPLLERAAPERPSPNTALPGRTAAEPHGWPLSPLAAGTCGGPRGSPERVRGK